MSVYFLCDTEDIWNPSSRVAQIFVNQVTGLENLLSIKSGVGEIVDDEVEVNKHELELFIKELVNYLNGTTHECIYRLISGCFSVLMGLGSKVGCKLPNLDEKMSHCLLEGKKLIR